MDIPEDLSIHTKLFRMIREAFDRKEKFDSELQDGHTISFYVENYEHVQQLTAIYPHAHEAKINFTPTFDGDVPFQQNDRHSDGIQQNDRHSDGIQQNDRHSDGIQQNDRHSDGIDEIDKNDKDDMIICVDGIEYVNQINLDYLDRIAKSEKIRIHNADKIVYPCKSITLVFDYPMMDEITFECAADNSEIGFTYKELIEKVLKYYRMIQMMHYHYNFNDGKFSADKIIDQKLFGCCLGDYLYDINIVGLRYVKKYNRWIVEYDDYC